MIDIQARQKLATKQLNDNIVREIRNNIPQIPKFDTDPIEEHLTDTNKIGEEQLNMTVLNYELLKRIDESLLEMVTSLKELKETVLTKGEVTTGETEIINLLKDLKLSLRPEEE